MNFEPHQEVAVTAAKKAAGILQSRFGNISRIRKKAAEEIVTEADTESEKEIIAIIRSSFPGHGILSEECGMMNPSSEYRWIIDPLDGTVNFAHQVPIFCISIALTFNGEVVLGVVFNPLSGELFSAVSGKGAQLNARPIKVSSVADISASLLVTGFAYNVNEIFNPVITRYGNCLKVAQGLRRLGSAALDLCYVACGRFEGFWEQNLKPWDTAAGCLIVAEAGGLVTTFSNQPFTVDHLEILATNEYVHGQMIELLKV
ncbi:MAG: inositol monophosphatase family protein [Deltaproteobacteria bacterium]|nr:inositol monophosphatase family protein [Deltaproteobacteria bacterium]